MNAANLGRRRRSGPLFAWGSATLWLFLQAACAQAEENGDEAWLDVLLGLDVEESSGSDAAAQDATVVEDELMEALGELTAWSVEASLSSGAGVKQNVLYSSQGGADSAFGQLELDLFALKPGLGRRPDLLGLLYVDYRYFQDVPGLTDERLAVGHLQASSRLWNGAKGTVGLEGISSKQALDASTDDFEVEALAVTLWRPEFNAGVEQTWDAFGSVKAQVGAAASRYNASSEDFDERALGIDWVKALSPRLRLSFGCEIYQESYAHRQPRLSSGAMVGDGGLLEIGGTRWQGELAFVPDDGPLRKWRTRLLYRTEDDRVGDYYERDQWEIRESFEWGWGAWTLDATAAYGMFDYASRAVSYLDLSPRGDEILRLNTKLSRTFGRKWEAFAQLDWAEKSSNAERYGYETSSAAIGIRLSKVARQ